MIKYILLFLAMISFGLHAEDLMLSQQDLNRVEWLRNKSDNALVRESLGEEEQFRNFTKHELFCLLHSVGDAGSKSNETPFTVAQRVASRMQDDLQLAQGLNHMFAKMPAGANGMTWSCKTNKLIEIISEAIALFEKHGIELLIGHLPEEFEGYWDSPRCLGPCAGRLHAHNHRELALKASLVLAAIELNGDDHLRETSGLHLEYSSLVHSTPLPQLTPEIVSQIQKLSFFYNETQSPISGELAFVHGGYAFGGQRDDVPYMRLFGKYGKPNGPQDCSSWIAKILGFGEVMSTVDFAEYYRDRVAKLAKKDFYKLEPVGVETIHDVKPGMIWVSRRFDLSKDPTKSLTLGVSGHTLLIIDVDATTNSFLTLEYSRDLPHMEGFGVRRMSFAVPENIMQMFFRTR